MALGVWETNTRLVSEHGRTCEAAMRVAPDLVDCIGHRERKTFIFDIYEILFFSFQKKKKLEKHKLK
jgi:hypothetical protein